MSGAGSAPPAAQPPPRRPRACDFSAAQLGRGDYRHTVTDAAAARRDASPGLLFAGAALVGALVALTLGVYGKVHDPASETTIRWFFTTTLHFKAWMTTVAVFLAIL